MIRRFMDSHIFKLLEVFIPIIVSVVAIYISVSVASNQNNIALFEKRYDVYQTYKTMIENAYSAEEAYSVYEIETSFETWIAFVAHMIPKNTIMEKAVFDFDNDASENDYLEVYMHISKEITDCCIELESAKYIFEFSEYEEKEIDKIVNNFYSITAEGITLETPYEIEQKIFNIIQSLIEFDLISKMEHQMDIL